MTLVIEKFRKVFALIFTSLLIFCCFFTNPKNTFADSEVNGNPNRKEFKRSLESLRDFDYQTWQIIVYPSSKVSNKLNLRIVALQLSRYLHDLLRTRLFGIGQVKFHEQYLE